MRQYLYADCYYLNIEIFQFGEQCGGFGNAAGVCSGGLGCLVRYQPGLETEHNKTGTCVTEQGEECSNPKSGVSCRPGQLGVPSDFVFCPQSCKAGSNRNKANNAGFLFCKYYYIVLKNFVIIIIPTCILADGPTRRSEGGGQGSLGATIGQGVREVVGNVPETVKDTVRDFLTG